MEYGDEVDRHPPATMVIKTNSFRSSSDDLRCVMFIARALLTIAITLSVQNTTLAEKKAKKTDAPPAKKEQKVERRSVTARVESAVGKGTGIRAEKVPREFTIPKGMTATNFKYRFHDPKSKIKLDKLTKSSIYSITEKRYISEATSGPNFELPPGKYKFVVGGRPGAYGSLSFDVAPGNSTSVATKGDPDAKTPGSRVKIDFTVTATDSFNPGATTQKASCEAVVSRQGEQFVLTFDESTLKMDGIPDDMIQQGLANMDSSETVWILQFAQKNAAATVSGTTRERATWTDPLESSMKGFRRIDGTLSGQLAGRTLSGTGNSSGVTKPTRKAEGSFKATWTWQIENFPVPKNAGSSKSD